MSIRKIVDLPFIDPNNPLMDESLLEISEPRSFDNLGQFQSHAIHCDDFKIFALREISNKNTFPNGIYISGDMTGNHTDIVDGLSVNAYPYSAHRVQIPYAKNFERYVEINGIPDLRVTSPTTIELSSPDTKFYATYGNVDVVVQKGSTITPVASIYQDTANFENIVIPSNTSAKVNLAPQIIEGPRSILESGPRTQVNVDAMWTALNDVIENSFSDETLGPLAYYDYDIVGRIPTGRNIKSNCFYFVTSNIY